MTNLLDIRRRLRSTDNIAQILEAMQVISYTKIRKSQDRIKQSQAYQAGLLDLLALSLAAGARLEHPLIRPNAGTAQVLVLLRPAQEGFASEFDQQLSRQVNCFLEQRQAKTRTKVMVLSRKRGLHLTLRSDLAAEEFRSLAAEPSPDEAGRVARSISTDYLAKKYQKVYFAYNTFKSVLSQPTQIVQLLPLEIPVVKPGGAALYFLEDRPSGLLDQLLPNYLAARIWQILVESHISELYTRLKTLRSAGDNAKEMIVEITNNLNKTRQSLITQELTNIFSSFLILKGGEEQAA